MVDLRDEAKETREHVAGEKVSRVPMARCPNCGNLYCGCSTRFLYSDEYGSYCQGCGSTLVQGVDLVQEKATHRCRLIICERLEGSALHRHLQELAKESGLSVLVDRTGAVRTTRLEPLY